MLIHFCVSRSTTSSSSSCSSLINGSISGKRPNHSSPSLSVRLCSHLTAASRVWTSSDLIYLSITAFISLWWSADAAEAASSVIVGIMSSTIARLDGFVSCFKSGLETALKCEGACQKSKSRVRSCPNHYDCFYLPSWSCSKLFESA